MSDLNDRIKKIQERADQASAEIRKAESMLRDLPGAPQTEYLSIKWDREKQRIMMGDKPLIEHKIADRLTGHYYLDCLINAVVMNTEKLFDQFEKAET